MSLETKEIKVCGGVTYWSLGTLFTRQTLVDGFHDLGLKEYTPEVRGPASALSEAVREHYASPAVQSSLEKNEKLLFRKIDLSDEPKDTYGLAVVLETLEAGGNDYQTVHTFKTVGNDGTINVSPGTNIDLYESVNKLYRKHRQTVGQHAVARSLVEALGYLGGTVLRPAGGIYWLDDSQLETWEKLGSVVASATLEGQQSCLYLLRTILDDSAVRAVRDAIVSEIQIKAAKIEENSKSGNIGERAFRQRRREAQNLHDRVSYFENLLGVALKQLHEAADTCEQEVVEAGLAEFDGIFAPTPPELS